MHTYVADRDTGLRIIDVSDPTNPKQVAFYPPIEKQIGHAYDVAVSGNYVYLTRDYVTNRTDTTAKFIVLNIGNLSHPVEVASLYNKANLFCVTLVEGYLYVVDMYFGIHIINVNDPSHPKEVSNYKAVGLARHIDVNGNLAYVANYMHGLRILDVSNPLKPTEVEFYNMGLLYPESDYSFLGVAWTKMAIYT